MGGGGGKGVVCLYFVSVWIIVKGRAGGERETEGGERESRRERGGRDMGNEGCVCQVC